MHCFGLWVSGFRKISHTETGVLYHTMYLCTMYYVLCTMYYVLCTMYYVLSTMYYVLYTIY